MNTLRLENINLHAPYRVMQVKTAEGKMDGQMNFLAIISRLDNPNLQLVIEGQHPMIVAAKFHGYYEYLHPFRDGNGRTGRLLSNFILLRADHPILIIKLEDRSAYISALKQIRTEGSDEYLVTFFFKTAIDRMKNELAQKKKNTLPMIFF